MRKVIYQCFGGAHSSVVAAGIHLGLLPMDRIADGKEILSLFRFDNTTPNDMGVPYFMGTDEGGNEVYVVGVGKAGAVAAKTIRELLALFGFPESDVVIVPTLASVGPLTRVGGFLSRRMRLTKVGRPLVVAGVRRNYSSLAHMAAECRKWLGMEVAADVGPSAGGMSGKDGMN